MSSIDIRKGAIQIIYKFLEIQKSFVFDIDTFVTGIQRNYYIQTVAPIKLNGWMLNNYQGQDETILKTEIAFTEITKNAKKLRKYFLISVNEDILKLILDCDTLLKELNNWYTEKKRNYPLIETD